jgi:hypothetical protein
MRECSARVLANLLLIAATIFTGCSSGQRSGRPDLDAIPEEERRGSATKADLYLFRAKVRKRGVAAAKQDVPELVESMSAYEKLKVGQGYKDTMKQIVEKLTALQNDLNGSPTKESVTKAAEEIGTLADKLPGKAEANPQVE